MSTFNCETCNTELTDTPMGYVAGCSHYPVDQSAINYYIQIYNGVHISNLKKHSVTFTDDWFLGQRLWRERK